MRRFASRELFWWGLLAMAAVALVVCAYLFLPDAMVSGRLSDAERLKAENDVRSSAIQAIGAVAVAIGFFLTARTYVLTRREHATDRFTTAVEQLTGNSPTQRRAAIAALERIARQAEGELHWQVMEALTGHLRETAKPKEGSPLPGRAPAEVQAIIDVLGRRDRRRETESQRLDLSETDLRRVLFVNSHLEGADFTRARLDRAISRGEVHLDDAILVSAVLDGIWFDEVHLEGADLRDARLRGRPRLRGARLARADLTGAELEGVDLDGAHGVDLSSANVR